MPSIGSASKSPIHGIPHVVKGHHGTASGARRNLECGNTTISGNEPTRTLVELTTARTHEAVQILPKREADKDRKRVVKEMLDLTDLKGLKGKTIKVENVQEKAWKDHIKLECKKEDIGNISVKLENTEIKRETNSEDFKPKEIKTEKCDDEQDCQPTMQQPASFTAPASFALTSATPQFAASASSPTEQVAASMSGNARSSGKEFQITVKPNLTVPPTRMCNGEAKTAPGPQETSSPGYTTSSPAAHPPKYPTLVMTQNLKVQVAKPATVIVCPRPQLGQPTIMQASSTAGTSAAGGGIQQQLVAVRQPDGTLRITTMPMQSNQSKTNSSAGANSSAASVTNQQRLEAVPNECIQVRMMATGTSQTVPRGNSGTIGPIRPSSSAPQVTRPVSPPYSTPATRPVLPPSSPVIQLGESLSELEEENKALKWHLSYYQHMLQDKGKLIAFLRIQGIEAH